MCSLWAAAPINREIKNMRDSMIKLIETCFDVKCHLSLGSYELHHYDDGSYCDFNVSRINDPRALNNIVGDLEYRIYCINGQMIVRIFEDFKEY